MSEFRKLSLISVVATSLVASPVWASAQSTTAAPAQTAPSSQTGSGSKTPPPGQSGTATSTTDAAGNPTNGDASAAATEEQSNGDKNKKKLSKKDDVDEIGNRDIGGRGLGNWYSVEREVRLGKALAQQMEQTVKLIDDPVIGEYVNRVGQNIVRNSDCKVPFTIKVVDDDQINAVSLPGGFFYVNSGLILAADNESELAGVMAHETAHVCAHHGMRQQTRANWAQIGTIPLIIMGGGVGYAAYEAASLAVPLTFMKFQRGFEAEADYLGVQYMYKAGYDPQSFVDFFEKIQAQDKKKPGTIVKAFSSHPQTPDRIENSQKEIAKILPSKAQYIVTTSEFDSVKSRLAAIENKRKLRDDKDSGKPTLRRASASSKTGNTNGTSNTTGDKDDDRPTLKRRDQ